MTPDGIAQRSLYDSVRKVLARSKTLKAAESVEANLKFLAYGSAMMVVCMSRAIMPRCCNDAQTVGP